MPNEWQLIKTAPMNGNRILVAKYHKDYNGNSVLWWITAGKWSKKDGFWDDGTSKTGIPTPSHWKTLPEPPEMD